MANVGHCSMVVAKLWGALYALEIAWSLGITHLILELDSLSAMNLIKQPIDNKLPYSALILKIKLMLDRSWAVRVEHIYREGFGLRVFCDAPRSLCSILSDDFRGVACPA